MSQELRPISDLYAGSWVPSTGSDAHAVIDEAVANDADFISVSTGLGAFPNTTVLLAPGTDPGITTGHVIHARARRSGGSSSPTIELYQGDPMGFGGIIATLAPTVTGSFADYSHTLSGAEAGNITDYTDLYLMFSPGFGGGNTHYVSQAWLEVPDLPPPPASLVPTRKPTRRTDIDLILLLEATR